MLARYLRTLGHLRLCQWIGQVRVRIYRHWRNPARLLDQAAPRGRLVSQAVLTDLPAPVPHQPSSDLKAGCFTFLSETRSLGRPLDWEAPGASRLWRYNLHYFDWLWSLLPENAPDWQTARDLTLDWIARHPPARNACGWEPYPTSLRLLNWSLLFGIRHRERTNADPVLSKVLLESMHRQVSWLERNLETHIQANHLLENLAALACTRSTIAWDDPQPPPQRILHLLERELDEQILADGMHYERSPMYHVRMLWVIEALRRAGPDEFRQRVEDLGRNMRQALALLRHPDSGIPLLNDSALAVYADGWTNQVADDGPWALPEAGYYGCRAGGDFVVIDAGPIGPDHQPGHAHADFFSFELSLAGRRVITDTGVESYVAGPGRAYDRSTAAHNTVEVDGNNSVEVWGSFRVGRRVRPEVTTWQPLTDSFVLEAEHQGYHHLPAKAIHRRRFSWQPWMLEIADELRLRQMTMAVARFHFAPEVEVTMDGATAHGVIGGNKFRIETEGADTLHLERSMYHPSFNVAVSRSVLCLRLRVEPPKGCWRIRVLWDHP
jgi:uncharacterized heparinase superfamily protein